MIQALISMERKSRCGQLCITSGAFMNASDLDRTGSKPGSTAVRRLSPGRYFFVKNLIIFVTFMLHAIVLYDII